MGSFDTFIIVSLSSILIIHYHTLSTTAQVPYYAYHFCLGSNYTLNSKYQTNLDLLLSSLTSTFNDTNTVNTFLENGYRNVTVGQNPDTVFGSIHCRGDLFTSDVCEECINLAAKTIIKYDFCPTSKGAIIWYSECSLRYSNKSYFKIMNEKPGVYLANADNITNPNTFFRILGRLLDDLVTEAVLSNNSSSSSSSGPINYATGEANYARFEKMYGQVQCTPDISSLSCSRCLRVAIGHISACCDGMQGGRVIYPSCTFRYEIYPFYKSKLVIPAPPPPSPPLVLPPEPGSPPAARSSPTSTTTITTKSKRRGSSKLAIIIVVPSILVLLSALAVFGFCFQRRKKMKKFNYNDVDHEVRSAESLQFNFSIISAATDNFSEGNKLGQGGFGSVYKGTLRDGEEIAVKRLSINSGQGDQEFKNEVILVAKLQHRNLVRLIGFCLHGEEKLLIYELMPNSSLDRIIFDPVRRTILDWEKRYRIIGGIARGLLYLHEDSRLRIIHRDLKASNILLNEDMVPKISDFGMARLFVVDQTQANTNRIVGTYGYMAPEYAMHGQFSVKSDVFSFGVLVLEILSGEKNTSFYESVVGGAQDLLSYAWKHWNNGTFLECLDPIMRDSCSTSEVMRCIHIALLCVQDDIALRPTMASTILMLNSNLATLPVPAQPAYFVSDESIVEAAVSVNEVSITELEPR